MGSAEVIYRSHHVHGLMERFGLTRQGTFPLACEDRSPKYILYGRDIRRKAVNTEQQSTIQSATTHLLYQICYQISIAMGAHYANQPKTSEHLKCHCQTSYAAIPP